MIRATARAADYGRHVRSAFLVSAIALAATVGVSCSSDEATKPPASSSGPTVSTTDEATIPLDTAPVEVLRGDELCARITAEVVTNALALTITAATASDDATPQCAYGYTSDSGSTSNVTIASMRPDEDLGGRLGVEAYEYVVDLNRMIGGEIDEQAVDAGDQAMRLSGEALHLGILQLGQRVITVIVPATDAEGDQVDALLAQIAELAA